MPWPRLGLRGHHGAEPGGQPTERDHMRRALIAVSAVGLILVVVPSSAFGFDCGRTLDDFNRPNSTNMGSAWTEQANDMQIETNAATNPLPTEALMTFNPATANQACV